MKMNAQIMPAVGDQLTGLRNADVVDGPLPSRLEREVIGLFDQFRIPLLRFLLSFRISSPEAEDLVQHVFLLLFEHLRQGKSRTNLRAWLFGVAHRLALRHRAQSYRRSDRYSEMADLSGFADLLSPGPDERMELIERRERMLAVISALPEQDQKCLSLRAEGLRYRDIAGVLGISLGSVANSIERALGRLTRAAGF